MTIDVGKELSNPGAAVWPISDRYVMRLFFAGIVSGEPVTGCSHDAIRWVDAADLRSIDWLSSDRAALGQIFEA